MEFLRTRIWILHDHGEGLVIGFLDSYFHTGDWVGGLIAVYTSRMGNVFFGIVVLATLIPPYKRHKRLDYILIFWMLVGGTLEYLIPTPVLSISHILIIFGLFTVLYRLFVRK